MMIMRHRFKENVYETKNNGLIYCVIYKLHTIKLLHYDNTACPTSDKCHLWDMLYYLANNLIV
jgi:hypothetical protein